MVRIGIGVVLEIMAMVIVVMLVTGGGPLLPHIVGPIALAIIGAFLLTRTRNSARSLQ